MIKVIIFKKLEKLQGKKWDHILGDGKASQRIAEDLAKRVLEDRVKGHKREQYHIPTERSYREDEIEI